MKIVNRIELLEQRLNGGVLTDIEQNELFELLESEGRLDGWLDRQLEDGLDSRLDSSPRLAPDMEVVYAEKESLKLIGEPIVTLKPDLSVTYENKSVLYRKGSTSHLTRYISIAVSVAAVLLLFFVWERSPSVDTSLVEVTRSVIALQEPEVKVDNSSSAEQRKMPDIEKVKSVAKIVEAIKRKSFEPVVDSRSHETYMSDLNAGSEPRLSHIELEIEVREAVVLIYDDVPIVKQAEFILFAQAEEWQKESKTQPEDIIMNYEEWQSSDPKLIVKVRSVLEHLKGKIL